MADHAPFHVQLDEYLQRRFWTVDDLLKALRAPRGRRAEGAASLPTAISAEDLAAILAGQLAPTQAFGERIATLVIGAADRLDVTQRHAWEELVGAAYVAESHGRRQQPPYTHGILGEPRRSNYAQTIDLQSTRQVMVDEQKRQRLIIRLVELEDEQSRTRLRQATNGKATNGKPLTGDRNRRKGDPPRVRAPQLARLTRSSPISPEEWNAAATASVRFIPDQARRDDRAREASLMHVIGRSFAAGHTFAQFLNSLLAEWRSEEPSRRGRRQTRMSPEQLGEWIERRNSSRYASDREKQDWFRRHQGPAVTGSSLRNYLAHNSESPQRECVQKLIWAFVVDGGVQLSVELRLWKMVAGPWPLAPRAFEPTLDSASDHLASSPIDVALARGDRGLLLRAFIDLSGMPVARIAELTDVHESLFQQWMRDQQNRRIEDRQRAARIVDLLNPPDLARSPLTSEQIASQNERAIHLLTSNSSSLANALQAADECPNPAEYGLDDEGQKTYRAAFLLREVFGRDSVSNLTGPEVGRLLEAHGLGDRQVFKHLREGVRDGGRKSARRATLDQAHFLADLLEQIPGGLDSRERQRFLERVACVDLEALANLPTPTQLLRQVSAPQPTLTIREVTRELMRRRGGLVKFAGEVGVCQQTIRSFISPDTHHLHHSVARRLATRGMGFAASSEEHRQFVVYCTAAWKQPGQPVPVQLSRLAALYTNRLQQATSTRQARAIRADAMGWLLSQAALSPRELARALGVTLAVLAGWTSPRGGHFTRQSALDRFLKRMKYEAEQIEFVVETFGLSASAPCVLAAPALIVAGHTERAE